VYGSGTSEDCGLVAILQTDYNFTVIGETGITVSFVGSTILLEGASLTASQDVADLRMVFEPSDQFLTHLDAVSPVICSIDPATSLVICYMEPEGALESVWGLWSNYLVLFSELDVNSKLYLSAICPVEML
jgi:hypothetical protein